MPCSAGFLNVAVIAVLPRGGRSTIWASGARVVLRSKTPALVRQEFWGLLLAHFAVRGLMHEAALRADEDPDRLSFLHAVRVVRRKLPLFAALPPSGQARPA